MGFRGEVHDHIRAGQGLGDHFVVTDVTLDEGQSGRVRHRGEIVQRSGVGQGVEH